jgi:hypothetical protein
MPTLPLVLAGPIVRRVEPTSCAFWIALSEAADVTVTLWQNSQMAGDSPGTISGGALSFATSVPTSLRKIGDRLFIGVITVELSKDGDLPLTPGSVYSYDLSFSGAFGISGLKKEGLLQDETAPRLQGVDSSAPQHLALGYLQDRLPAFVAPAAVLEQIRLAHASCRKTNGSREDSLAWLDDEIKDNFEDTERRVQQLFLTGDQIYADDLGACLLPMLNDLGRELIGVGRAEQLPVGSSQFEGNILNFPALRRAKLIRGEGGLSSTDGQSHLLTFGEFAAMYLCVWSPRVWRTLSSNSSLFVAGPTDIALNAALTDIEACYRTESNPLDAWQKKSQKSADYDRKQVEAFRDTVPKVARALANVATYMIFDDHEITDDWNLNKRWRNRVYSRALGKAIVRNGMMAYGLFQAWGNDPAEFVKSDSNNKKFLDETQKVLGTSSVTSTPILPVGSTDIIDQLISSTEGSNSQRVKWNYLVPCPRHMVCVLDTRTRRTFEGDGLSPPNLLGETLDNQVPAGPMVDGRELLIVISAVPVLGPQLIDQLAAPLYEFIGDFKYGLAKGQNKADDPCKPHLARVGVEYADAESWAANEAARENFLKRLAPHGKVIILSGDVHYGLTIRMDYWRGTNNSSTPIIQMTSSPSRNSFKAKVEALVRNNAKLQQYEEGLPPELLGWNSSKPFSLPDGAKTGPGRQARLRRSPALLPTRGWPEGTAIASDKQPDWCWRVQLVRDVRPETEMPIDSPKLPKLDGADLDPLAAATHMERYTVIAARHQMAALIDSFWLFRRIVFTSNIGLVNIIRADGSLAAEHTLLSQSSTPPYRGVANTQHVTLLAPTSDAVPTLQVGS